MWVQIPPTAPFRVVGQVVKARGIAVIMIMISAAHQRFKSFTALLYDILVKSVKMLPFHGRLAELESHHAHHLEFEKEI